MKKLVSVLLIMTLAFSAFMITPMSAYAEEVADEVVDDTTTTPDQDETVDGDASTGEETTEPEDGTVEDDTTTEGDSEENTENGDESDTTGDFLSQYLPIDALTELKDALFGFVEQMFNFIANNETYSSIATAALAVLAVLAIPVVFAGIVIVYAAIGGMVIIAGALTAVVEVFFEMVPSFFL